MLLRTGVISALTDLGLLGPDTVVSGSSAGAIAVALIASGLDMEEIMEENLRFQSQMLEKGTFWKLADMLKTSLMVKNSHGIYEAALGCIC